jgi:hypothetical protein
MAAKAKNILDVLGRRKEIEDYLTKLEIRRDDEDSTELVISQPAVREKIGNPMVQDSTTLRPVNLNNIDSNTTGRKPQPQVTAKVPEAGKPAEVKRDTVAATSPEGYTYRPETPHAVVIMLDKVDPVYVTETRNAFNRYHSQQTLTSPIEITNQTLSDTVRLVVMTGFANAAAAMQYVAKTQPVAATQIVPWLPAGKLSFWVISPENLERLKNRQNIGEYREFFRRYE